MDPTVFSVKYGDSDNSEYFSQGIVNHKGRSCVSSLKDLIDAGLCKLYPEFDGPERSRGWTGHLRVLRSKWTDESWTRQQDVSQAFKIAEFCFPTLKAIDMALLLSTFQNRRLNDPPTNGIPCSLRCRANLTNFCRYQTSLSKL